LHLQLIRAIVAATIGSALAWGGPLRITLRAGVATTVDRIPAGGGDTFLLSATGGETLALELNPCCPRCVKTDLDRSDEIRVLPDDGSQPDGLPSRMAADEIFWHWINVLPHSGVYRVVISRPSKRRYRLRALVMAANDPRLNPGLSADRVSIGSDLMPQGKALAVVPYETPSFCEIDSNWPAYLGIEDYYFGVEIMRMDGVS